MYNKTHFLNIQLSNLRSRGVHPDLRMDIYEVQISGSQWTADQSGMDEMKSDWH